MHTVHTAPASYPERLNRRPPVPVTIHLGLTTESHAIGPCCLRRPPFTAPTQDRSGYLEKPPRAYRSRGRRTTHLPRCCVLPTPEWPLAALNKRRPPCPTVFLQTRWTAPAGLGVRAPWAAHFQLHPKPPPCRPLTRTIAHRRLPRATPCGWRHPTPADAAAGWVVATGVGGAQPFFERGGWRISASTPFSGVCRGDRPPPLTVRSFPSPHPEILPSPPV